MEKMASSVGEKRRGRMESFAVRYCVVMVCCCLVRMGKRTLFAYSLDVCYDNTDVAVLRHCHSP